MRFSQHLLSLAILLTSASTPTTASPSFLNIKKTLMLPTTHVQPLHDILQTPSSPARSTSSSSSSSSVKSRRSSLDSISSTQHLIPTMSGGAAVATIAPPASASPLKLLFGITGIYASFLYYGSLQEDVFHYSSPEGLKFKQAWLLQVLEALANVIVGASGLAIFGGVKVIPQKAFAVSGITQVSSKAFTSLALANGLSFPVATLAKSGKMVPVMLGSLLLGGASYSVREYLQVVAIILGTAIVSMGNKKGGGASSSLGLAFIILSLACDGVTGGVQKKLKAEAKKLGVNPGPYDFMFWTNLYMMLTAIVVAFGLGEVGTGLEYMKSNPEILNKIASFAACSAVGQSFIFYTIANFDPLVCTTVTTTRKIFSVLLSIFLKGHQLNAQGWLGITLACTGILAEMQNKMGGHAKVGGEKKH